ncbi:MAG: aromatic hydrocarbon degradation protein [Bacteroidales bacterium]|nr:aromatic hydrocarbon degradation protein [Bacteroidales bacterium]
MRKFLISVIGTLITGSMFAGGLVTNTNQSALYTRLQSRNASTGIDAVYYNPAGLTKLGDGFFFSVNNQTIGQTRSVLNNYTYLTGSPKEYIGTVSAPLFPSVYAAFKAGKFAVSAGFNPIGGGGGATYEDGLPSFEMSIADLVPLLVSRGIPATQYSADIFFEGTSTYFGYQANVSYEINKMLSVAAGVRYVTAKNTYNGALKSIMVNPAYPAFGAGYTGGMVLASDFFASGATTLTGLAGGATALSALIAGKIAGGVDPTTLLTDAATNGLEPTQIGTIQAIVTAAQMNPEGINIATAQAIMTAAAPQFTANAGAMAMYSVATQDIEVDAEQTGSGFAPIISVNISPVDNLNIALRYEFKTKLELTTKVFDNKGGGVFTDGQKVIADMPAMFAAGVEFRPIDRLMVTGSMNVYFDKNNDYDGSESFEVDMINKNFKEFALGAELGLTRKIRVSAGWLGTFTGVNELYQNDQRYSTNSNTFGGGLGIRLLPMVDLNIGGQYTIYAEGSKGYNYMLGQIAVPVTETYDKDTWIIGAGLDFFFGKR